MDSKIKNHAEMTDLELIDHVLLVNVTGGRINQCVADDYNCIEISCGGTRGCSEVQDYENWCGG